jgi:cobalt-zinc-cadmium efflux system outer membrane protein
MSSISPSNWSRLHALVGSLGRRSGGAALVFVSLFPFVSGAGEVLTLEAALELALRNNPTILAARREIDVARSRLTRAQYWNPFNPEVETGLGTREFHGGGSELQGSAGVSLEVEVAGQRGKRIEEAQRNLERVEAEVADVERRVLASTKEAFYGVLHLRQRLDLFGRVEDLARRSRDASAERFRAGKVPKLEANVALVRFDRSRKDTLAAERDLENQSRELERLLGLDPRGGVEVTGELAVPSLDPSLDDLIEIALRSRPDLRAREAEIRRIDAEISLTRRLAVPNPTLVGFYEEEVERAGERDRIFGAAVRIPVPVFDRKRAELESLEGEKSRALHERAAAVLQVKEEVRAAWQSWQAARKAVAMFQRGTVARIQESYRLLETAYREGKIDLLSLLSGQHELVDAELSYLDSVGEYWRAHVALERAVGAPVGK